MRAYLDHNATTPLRPEAREAMIEGDVPHRQSLFGPFKKVARRNLLWKRRVRAVASAFGADGAEVVFTSSATEAAALGFAEGEIFWAAMSNMTQCVLGLQGCAFPCGG